MRAKIALQVKETAASRCQSESEILEEFSSGILNVSEFLCLSGYTYNEK